MKKERWINKISSSCINFPHFSQETHENYWNSHLHENLPSYICMIFGCWTDDIIWISRRIRTRSASVSIFAFFIVLMATCKKIWIHVSWKHCQECIIYTFWFSWSIQYSYKGFQVPETPAIEKAHLKEELGFIPCRNNHVIGAKHGDRHKYTLYNLTESLNYLLSSQKLGDILIWFSQLDPLLSLGKRGRTQTLTIGSLVELASDNFCHHQHYWWNNSYEKSSHCAKLHS